VIELSSATCLPVIPLSLVDRTIRPLHCASSMSEASQPFTIIDCTILILVSLYIRLLI
jgi:hypothetical protein